MGQRRDNSVGVRRIIASITCIPKKYSAIWQLMHLVGVVESSFPCRVRRPKTPFRAVARGYNGQSSRCPARTLGLGVSRGPSSACHSVFLALRSALHACHLSAEKALPEQMASHQTAAGRSWQDYPCFGSTGSDMLKMAREDRAGPFRSVQSRSRILLRFYRFF